MGKRKMHTDSWWKNLKERDHLEARRVNCRKILKYIFKKFSVRVWTGFI